MHWWNIFLWNHFCIRSLLVELREVALQHKRSQVFRTNLSAGLHRRPNWKHSQDSSIPLTAAPWQWLGAWALQQVPPCRYSHLLHTTLLGSPASDLIPEVSQSQKMKFLHFSEPPSKPHRTSYQLIMAHCKQRPFGPWSLFAAAACNCLSEKTPSTHIVLISAIHRRKAISSWSLQVIIFCPEA